MNWTHTVQSASTHSRPANRIGAWWLLLVLLLVNHLELLEVEILFMMIMDNALLAQTVIIKELQQVIT